MDVNFQLHVVGFHGRILRYCKFMMYIIFDLKTLCFFLLVTQQPGVDSVTHVLGGIESCDVAESCGQRWFGGDEEMWWQLGFGDVTSDYEGLLLDVVGRYCIWKWDGWMDEGCGSRFLRWGMKSDQENKSTKQNQRGYPKHTDTVTCSEDTVTANWFEQVCWCYPPKNPTVCKKWATKIAPLQASW